MVILKSFHCFCITCLVFSQIDVIDLDEYQLEFLEDVFKVGNVFELKNNRSS